MASRQERIFNTKIYKLNKYYIELFIKLIKQKHQIIIKKIIKKLERQLNIQIENLNVDDNLIQFLISQNIELKEFYDKFVEIFINAVFQDSSFQAKEFIRIFKLEPKTNAIDIKSLDAIIKNAKNEFGNIIKAFDAKIEAFKKVKAVSNQKDIDKILSKNILKQTNVKKAERDIKELLISIYEDSRIKIKNRSYGIDYYAEIVARSRLREAASLGIIEEAKKYNITRFRFSIHNTNCQICKPYEGNIYSLVKNDRYSLLEIRPPLHPNCLHSLIPYVRD